LGKIKTKVRFGGKVGSHLPGQKRKSEKKKTRQDGKGRMGTVQRSGGKCTDAFKRKKRNGNHKKRDGKGGKISLGTEKRGLKEQIASGSSDKKG